jgi:hypothetical protein
MPMVARTRPATYFWAMGVTSARPQAAAGITAAFTTTIDTTRTTRRNGATSWRTVKDMPSEATVAPMEIAIPAMTSTVKRC